MDEYEICNECLEPFPVDEMYEDEHWLCRECKKKSDNRLIHGDEF